jgi:hypothetical protein
MVVPRVKRIGQARGNSYTVAWTVAGQTLITGQVSKQRARQTSFTAGAATEITRWDNNEQNRNVIIWRVSPRIARRDQFL